MQNNNDFVHFETTPREYYDHCTPDYDLYPSLSRRMVNGNSSNTWYRPHPMLDMFARLPADDDHQHQDQVPPPWDLYPLVLRNVENFGTEQMRQRLHAMTMV
ncbi:hypothetical protein BJV82DRAFT_584041 [Fennellomyces sp. T-0311]|nr:hypothetical protein BJV82DRAFT_584041 [Fennellomyces sp. T-0311]